ARAVEELRTDELHRVMSVVAPHRSCPQPHRGRISGKVQLDRETSRVFLRLDHRSEKQAVRRQIHDLRQVGDAVDVSVAEERLQSGAVRGSSLEHGRSVCACVYRAKKASAFDIYPTEKLTSSRYVRERHTRDRERWPKNRRRRSISRRG